MLLCAPFSNFSEPPPLPDMDEMTAPVFPLPSPAHQETIDFLRRLASMLTGGANAEMLEGASTMIETLAKRAAIAEQLLQEQQNDNARNLELREVAELASDNLITEVVSLKTQIETEIASLKAQLDEANQRAESERNLLVDESQRHQARADIAEARLAQAEAELEQLRQPAVDAGFDDSIAVVPVQSLKLARAQFDYLAKGFASTGDVVSQTICEIGASTLDKALASSVPGRDGG